jgi:hypothetical protein
LFAPSDLARGLSFDEAVPRHLVHKVSLSEVLLTGAVQAEKDRFVVAARWPSDHQLYRPTAPGIGDPSLLIESVRQSAIYICHRFYDIPPAGRPFVMAGIEVEIDAPGLPYAPGEALPVLLEAVCTRTATAPKRFGMAMEATLYIGGRRHGRSHVRWEVMDERRYAVVRSRKCAQPSADTAADPVASVADRLPAAVAGRLRPQDVLLAPHPQGTPGVWQLMLDESHPVYFDHGGDHVPGMVLIEAMRQAAHAATVVVHPGNTVPELWAPLSLASSFERFGALDAPVTITAQPIPGAEALGHFDFHLTATQHGQRLAALRLGGARPAAWSERQEAVAC